MKLITATGVVMARASDHHGAGGIITALVAAFVAFTRWNLLWALGAAAVAGIILARMGVGL